MQQPGWGRWRPDPAEPAPLLADKEKMLTNTRRNPLL